MFISFFCFISFSVLCANKKRKWNMSYKVELKCRFYLYKGRKSLHMQLSAGCVFDYVFNTNSKNFNFLFKLQYNRMKKHVFERCVMRWNNFKQADWNQMILKRKEKNQMQAVNRSTKTDSFCSFITTKKIDLFGAIQMPFEIIFITIFAVFSFFF